MKTLRNPEFFQLRSSRRQETLIHHGGRKKDAIRVSLRRLLQAFALLSSLPLLAAEPKFMDLSSVLPKPQTNVSDSSISTNAPKIGGTNAMEALDDKHKLAIGDHLSVRIIEDDEDPKQLFVSDLGDLEAPYVGRFPAVGRTCKQLAVDLKKELEKEYYYQATVVVAVDLMTKSRGKVYLVGPVRTPGPQDIPSDEAFTLSKAILRAGGFGDFADKKEVKLTRKDEKGNDKTFTINVAEILEKGKTEGDMTLEPGDFIYVPERSIRF
jgi:polysaccharide export outer membrane protein